jgi:hypothetical protein
MIKCTCDGKVDFSLSDIHLLDEDNHMRAGMEGLCLKCGASVYVKFLAINVEITNFEQDSKKFYDIERITGQIPKHI